MALKRWGDFEVDFGSLLGRGGMGAVFKGRQVSLDRPAAVKILKKDLTENPEFVKRFHREAALLARLVDAHVVQVFGAGEAEGQHFYAMEYVEGQDFSSLLRAGHKFTVDEVLQVALSVGAALQAAWKHRIIHRDIKPSNILKTKDGEIKVMDFGLAKNPESDLTQSEMIMGTAKYMSPEQATGEPCDIRSDLYALGVVLFELATGRPPFVGESATSMMYQQVHTAPPKPRTINAALPPEVEAMILRLLEKKPEARYPSPEALLSAVRGIQDGVGPDEKSTLYNETVLKPAGKGDSLAYAATVKVGATPSDPMPAAKGGGSGGKLALAAALLILGAGGYFVMQAVKGGSSQVSAAPETPPKPDPGPAAVPKPDPKPEVPSGPPYEEARKKGMEAFGSRQWVMAYTLLDEAEKLGAKDVAEKRQQARANEHIDKADAEPEEEAALAHLEAARKFHEDEALKQKIRTLSFRRWRKSAERNEGGDWTKAADDWQRALSFADEGQAEETRERLKFCSQFAEAVVARTTKDWAKAQAIYGKLALAPRAFSALIEQELKRAEAELAKMAETAEKELRREFDGLVEAARAALKRAAWAEAKPILERAREPKYKEYPRKDVDEGLAVVTAALGAPPGMVYVPAGKFRMGGGRPVEGPEGEAETGAFYIDEREVPAGDYAEFLKALDSFGHHPGCPKSEAPNKKHVPQDWEGQKPGDPVSGVDWWDAASFAAWKRKRLPRETEWEKAASFDPVAGRRDYAWGPRYQKEGGRSYLGIEGLGTGVIEWTADWFQKYPWSSAEHSDFGERKKVLRGGVLLLEDAADNSRAGFRHWYLPTYRSRKVGFRCAMDIEVK